MTNKDPKGHAIKVPIYSIPLYEDDKNRLFISTYDDIINFITNKLDRFNPILLNNGKKERQTLIKKIEFTNKAIGETPCVLVRCSVEDSNIGDTVIEDNDIITLSPDAKIRYANYCFLLYPKIDGLYNKKVCSIIMLVYDDPYHDSNNTSRIATSVIKKVLGLKPSNQKLDYIIKELEQTLVIPELQIKLSSLRDSDSNQNQVLSQYRVKSTKFKQENSKYQGVPQKDVFDVLTNDDCAGYDSKEIQITVGKKLYKVRKEIVEGIADVKLTIESVFNSSFEISDEEMKQLYNEDFIVEKLTPVLTNFMSNGIV